MYYEKRFMDFVSPWLKETKEHLGASIRIKEFEPAKTLFVHRFQKGFQKSDCFHESGNVQRRYFSKNRNGILQASYHIGGGEV